MSTDGELMDIGMASTAHLEAVGDVLEIGVLVLDQTLTIQGCNRWFATAMNGAPEDFQGHSIFEIFHSLAGSPAHSAFSKALKGATTVWSHAFHGYLFQMPAPEGYERFDYMQQSARLLPIRRDGVVEGMLILIQDVTERVAREQALKQAVSAAEVASQAKSDFLASMSHELRTPLSAIIGYMDLLLGDMVGHVPTLQKSYLTRVSSAARHLVTIIGEILTFSRVEAGKEPVYVEDVDVDTILRDAVELLEPQAADKNVAISLEKPDARVMMRSDATMVRQIVINLIGNAVKFTDQGSVVVTMTPDGDRIIVRVRDTGPGIPLVDTERVFEPFTQVDQSLRRTKGGTGLGLPVSRRLAHLLQGDLVVERTSPEGTTFKLSLPVITRPVGAA